ncbi:MAG: SMI1/KNR4 family protein [Ktedonobacterales bacterium]
MRMANYAWQEFLERWFHDVFAYREQEALEMMPQELVRSRWLGYPGASAAQIVAVEQRLGVTLPPSYRTFLATVNGCWLVSGYASAYAFWSTEQVEWFAVRNQVWIDAWLEGYHLFGPMPRASDEEYLNYGPHQGAAMREEYLQTMLEVSAEGDNSSIYLLNPQIVTPEGEWEAWYFDHEEITRYRSFWDMLHDQHNEFYLVRALEGKRPTEAGEA